MMSYDEALDVVLENADFKYIYGAGPIVNADTEDRFDEALAVLEEAKRPKPEWERARVMIEDLAAFVNHPNAGTHNIDQMASYCREWLSITAGINLRDERTLFDVFATLGLVQACAATGIENGRFTEAEAALVRIVIKVIGAALTTIVPHDALQ